MNGLSAFSFGKFVFCVDYPKLIKPLFIYLEPYFHSLNKCSYHRLPICKSVKGGSEFVLELFKNCLITFIKDLYKCFACMMTRATDI